MHLYNQANHDLATKVETALTQAKISESLVNERKEMDAIARSEQGIARRHTIARRDATLMEVIGQTNAASSWSRLQTRITERITELSRFDVPTYALFDQAVNESIRLQDSLEFQASVYRLTRKKGEPDLPKSCTDSSEVKKVQDKLSLATLPIFNQWLNVCVELDKAQVNLKRFYGTNSESLIGKVSREIENVTAAKSGAEQEYENRKAAFEAAKKAYVEAAGKTNKLSAEAEDLANALKKLNFKTAGDAFSKLEDLGFGGLGLEGELTRLEEERKAVLDVLGYVGSTNQQAKVSTNLSTFLVQFLPVVKTEGNKFLTPQLMHLLLIEEHLRIEADQVKRRMQAAKEQLDLLLEKRASLVAELEILMVAGRRLEKCGAAPSDKTLPQWIASSGPEVSQSAAEALAQFAISWNVGRVRQEVLDYRIIAARHSAALDSSEFALRSWENLIGVPIKQLVMYHGSGIKPEVIANLISAAAITAAIGAK